MSIVYMYMFMCVSCLLTDSNLYAHFVFKAFDVKSNGAISFKVSYLDYYRRYYNAGDVLLLKLYTYDIPVLISLFFRISNHDDGNLISVSCPVPRVEAILKPSLI